MEASFLGRLESRLGKILKQILKDRKEKTIYLGRSRFLWDLAH